MPRQTSQLFPRDEHGAYLTLEVLRNFKNADHVSILSIQVGDHTTQLVPNLDSAHHATTTTDLGDSSPLKIYFTALADVKI